MWQKGFIIAIGLYIGVFSGPLCVDTSRLSYASEIHTVLSLFQAELNIGSERGLERNS